MKRAKIAVTYELLQHMLRLPEGMSIEAAAADPDRRVVDLYMASEHDVPGLFTVAEGQSHPIYPYLEMIMRSTDAASLYSDIMTEE